MTSGNYTLTIIKPDAFASGKAGKIIAHLENEGYKVREAADGASGLMVRPPYSNRV